MDGMVHIIITNFLQQIIGLLLNLYMKTKNKFLNLILQ